MSSNFDRSSEFRCVGSYIGKSWSHLSWPMKTLQIVLAMFIGCHTESALSKTPAASWELGWGVKRLRRPLGLADRICPVLLDGQISTLNTSSSTQKPHSCWHRKSPLIFTSPFNGFVLKEKLPDKYNFGLKACFWPADQFQFYKTDSSKLSNS